MSQVLLVFLFFHLQYNPQGEDDTEQGDIPQGCVLLKLTLTGSEHGWHGSATVRGSDYVNTEELSNRFDLSNPMGKLAWREAFRRAAELIDRRRRRKRRRTRRRVRHLSLIGSAQNASS